MTKGAYQISEKWKKNTYENIPKSDFKLTQRETRKSSKFSH